MITLSKITFPRKSHTAGTKSKALRMLAEGFKPETVAKATGVNPTTVRNWKRQK